MTREEQDKLWAELSEWQKHERCKTYKILKEIPNPEEELKKYHLTSFELETLYGKHNLQPTLTYENVAKELFKDSALQADFYKSEYSFDTYPLNCTSEKQAKKLFAINRLLNVAKFLNKNEDGTDWKPDFNNENEDKWYLCISYQDDGDSEIIIDWTKYVNRAREIVYFRTEELAKQAVLILGEDVVRTALTTEY